MGKLAAGGHMNRAAPECKAPATLTERSDGL